MIADLHMHTCRRSPCSTIEPDTLFRLARERGLDHVVLTEHHSRWPEKSLEIFRQRHAPLAIHAGVEVTLDSGFDVVCLSEAVIEFAPYAPLDDLVDAVEDARGETFLFVAHPFRYQDAVTDELVEILDAVDGVEMNSVNIMKQRLESGPDCYRPRNHMLYEFARRKYGLTPVYNSDAHHEPAVGAVATKVTLAGGARDSDVISLGDLIRALKTGRTSERQMEELVRKSCGACA